MKAPKISHTVVLENPDSAQFNAARASLKPGFASCSGLKKTHWDSTATSVTPMSPIAPPGSGSNMRPTITPTKIAKKYHACCGRPSGAGMSAMMIATAIGAIAVHLIFMTPPLARVNLRSESECKQQPRGGQGAEEGAPVG